VTGDVQRLPVASLRRDGGTQVRAEVSAATVDNYREAMAEGAAFPPVVAFFDGVDHWLADGFHRVMAAESAGLADVLTEVREGTRRDALRYALGANRKHGLPMSGPDKRRAIGLLLADDEWRGMSDRAIAAEIGASDKTVASVRREMVEATAENPQLDTPRTGRDGKVRRQRTAPAPAVEPVQVEPAVEPAAPAPQEQPEAPAVEPAVEPDAAVQPAHETANDAAPVEPEAAKVSTQNGSESAEVESLRARLIEAERALAEARAEATSLRAAHVEPERPRSSRRWRAPCRAQASRPTEGSNRAELRARP
jgi:ParB-like chromosome segregation protein Spo0J